MAQFRKIPVVIEAITFDEFVEYVKKNTATIVHINPWSFEYKGLTITKEKDNCYGLGGSVKFTPQDMLITGVNGEIYPCTIKSFKKMYEEVNTNVDVGTPLNIASNFGGFISFDPKEVPPPICFDGNRFASKYPKVSIEIKIT